jgi:hypothetical protein
LYESAELNALQSRQITTDELLELKRRAETNFFPIIPCNHADGVKNEIIFKSMWLHYENEMQMGAQLSRGRKEKKNRGDTTCAAA